MDTAYRGAMGHATHMGRGALPNRHVAMGGPSTAFFRKASRHPYVEEQMSSPDDWQSSVLARFDKTLRCPICHEFFRGALMLSGCSHNCTPPPPAERSRRHLTPPPCAVCSICIRRALATSSSNNTNGGSTFVAECPLCRVPAKTTDLLANRLLDDLVASLVALAESLPEAVRRRPRPQDGLATPSGSSAHAPKEAALLGEGGRESSFPARRRVEGALPCAPPGHPIVECPICTKALAQSDVELHVEACLQAAGFDNAPSAPAADPVGQARDSPTRPPKKEGAPLKRIAKPIYHLLKDGDVRKALQELHLPTSGDREVQPRQRQALTIAAGRC